MSAYAVNVRPPGAFNGFCATVDRSGDVMAPRGVGYGATEREAIRRAWSDYWRKAERV